MYKACQLTLNKNGVICQLSIFRFSITIICFQDLTLSMRLTLYLLQTCYKQRYECSTDNTIICFGIFWKSWTQVYSNILLNMCLVVVNTSRRQIHIIIWYWQNNMVKKAIHFPLSKIFFLSIYSKCILNIFEHMAYMFIICTG